jgi:hypothetical protein
MGQKFQVSNGSSRHHKKLQQFSGGIAFSLGELFIEMEDYAEAEKYFK